MKKRNILIILICLVLLVSTTSCGKKENNSNNNINNNSSKLDVYAGAKKVNIEIENYGTISLELYPNLAPRTVENFISLVNMKFYDGLTFHRIMDGFMMQGGNAYGTEKESLAKNIIGEFEENGYSNSLSHTKGVISMARANDPNSASSQFFIVDEDSTFLDGKYASFGKVINGIEIVDKICKEAVVIDDNGTVPEKNQPVIKRIYMVD